MKRTIILSVFTLLVFGSCQRNSTVELRLNHAEELMSEHPDSAWHILESIDRKALDSRRIRARHALLSSQALDKNYIDVNNDSLIRIAIDYYAKHGSYEDRAKAYYYHAIVQGNASNTEAAIKALVIAEEYAKKTRDTLLNGLYFRISGTSTIVNIALMEPLQLILLQFPSSKLSIIKLTFYTYYGEKVYR